MTAATDDVAGGPAALDEHQLAAGKRAWLEMHQVLALTADHTPTWRIARTLGVTPARVRRLQRVLGVTWACGRPARHGDLHRLGDELRARR